MILGRITGKVTTTSFQFLVTSEKTRKFMFIQVQHPQFGSVLCQIMELERTSDELIAQCNVLGYKDETNRLKGIRVPFSVGSEVLEAQDEFIKDVIEISEHGAYLGKLEGKDIKVHVDLQKILTRHLAVLAKSGAGKSYTVGCLLEEIMEKNVPLLVIDPHGEYSSMTKMSVQDKEQLARWAVEPKGYQAQIKEYGDLNVNPNVIPLKLNEKMSSYELMKLLPISLSSTQEAMLFSVIKDLDVVNFDNIILGLEELNSSTKWGIIDTLIHLRDLKLFSSHYTPYNELVQPGKASILNLKGIDPQVQSMIVAKLLKDLFMARKQEKIPPFFCVIEEAHNFVPEKGFGKAQSSEVIRLISSEGRKFGLGLCVVSQRPALIQKTVLAQCSTQIIMKVTNPNDLRSIQGSVEGMTSHTIDEVQNLPVGCALICGVVDRPLVVNIRPRRSEHGGHAVDILGQSVKIEEKEQVVDVVKETKQFEQKGLMYLVMPKLSIKDIELMSTKPVTKITTYLIPAVLFDCEYEGNKVSFLLDRIKGKVILDPDTDQKCELELLGNDCVFVRRPVYDTLEFDEKLDAWISSGDLRERLSQYCKVEDFKECFIVFRKVEYQ